MAPRQRALIAPLLREVDLNLTDRCNLRCSFCSVDVHPVPEQRDELTLRQIEQLLADLDRLGVHTLRLVGGEPFVRRDIDDILRVAGSFGFYSSVLTNGMLISDRQVPLVRASGIDVLAFSVDGHEAALHNASRGHGLSFERVVSRLKLCGRFDIRRRMMTALTAGTIPHLVQLVDFADCHGFELLNFIGLGRGGAAERSPTSYPQYHAWAEAVANLTLQLHRRKRRVLVRALFTHENPVPLELYDPLASAGLLSLLEEVWGVNIDGFDREAQVGHSVCKAGHDSIAIMPNGDVFGCDLMRGHPEFCVGNVRETAVGELFSQSTLFQDWRAVPEFPARVVGPSPPAPKAIDFSFGQCRAGIAHMRKKILLQTAHAAY